MPHDDEGAGQPDVFSYRASKDGTVFVAFHGQTVTVLRGRAADRFLTRISRMDAAGVQGEMARVTGNFKHGNERTAKRREAGRG
jgi:hypothetical protein